MNIEAWEEYRYVAGGIDAFIRSMGDSGLKNIVDHVCNSGGKRIRPIILLLASETCSESYKNGLNAALAIEMMHSASLIHDDLLDEGLLRRNMPSAPEKFGPARALLCGDYLIAKSIEFISSYEPEVVEAFGKAGMAMAEGEVIDLRLEKPDFQEAEYFECIYKKTASLFEVSAFLGACIGGADETLANSFRLFGQNLGIAYQIVDDLLEFLDVLAGKQSNLQSETLPQIYMKRMSRAEAVQKSIQDVNAYVCRTKAALEKVPDGPARDKLLEITDYMTLDMLKKCNPSPF